MFIVNVHVGNALFSDIRIESSDFSEVTQFIENTLKGLSLTVRNLATVAFFVYLPDFGPRLLYEHYNMIDGEWKQTSCEDNTERITLTKKGKATLDEIDSLELPPLQQQS